MRRRRRPSQTSHEVLMYRDRMGTVHESYHEEKEDIRQWLRENGWRRDGRCKSWETYKKKIDGLDHRLKFDISHISFDSMVPDLLRTSNSERGRWQPQGQLRYIDMRTGNGTIGQTTSVTTALNEDDLDQAQYLDRIGAVL